jgi:alkanesulfonate monooxygenase SsuD/methylene tetrahydromethanopterin reductase-like flavin-dependent oxidoreductase (luciferase family)
VRIAHDPLNRYLAAIVEAAGDWTTGTESKDYANYGKMIEKLRADSFETNVASGAAWVGTPQQIREQIASYRAEVGDFEIASLQVNFNTIAYDDAKRSMQLFAEEVMPAIG